MNIRVYPITSFIHNKKAIEEESSCFLQRIEELGNCKFQIVDNFDSNFLTLIFIRTGGTEGKFKELYSSISGPFYLLSSKSSNSLAASMEILSFLRDKNEEAEIIHGGEEYIAQRIKEIYHSEKQITVKDRLGVIGKPSDWLISSSVNYSLIKRKLNVELVDIKMEELFKELEKKYIPDNQFVQMIKAQNFPNLEKALEVYGALKLIIDKYKLSGLTIRCFDLLEMKKCTSCLALAILNSEGYVASCEGDIPSLISMYIANKKINAPSFQVNPSSIDVLKKEIIFAHCTLPLKMTESYSFLTHFESGLGVAIKGKLPLGDVTVFKVSPNLDRAYIKEGMLIDNLNESNLCRTQIKVKLDDVEYFLKDSIGNHHLVIIGNYQKELQEEINKIKNNEV